MPDTPPSGFHKPSDSKKHSGGLPLRNSLIGRWLGLSGLKILGWKIKGELPDVPKTVAIAFPHTSNWDFVIGLLVMLATNLNASWIGKAEMFRWPLGGLWKRLGGIPVVRGKQQGGVAQQIVAVRQSERIFLLIEPEGTRSACTKWKTGFYRIAVGAGVPILPITWDFPSKTLTFLPLFEPTGNMTADIRELMMMARHCKGRNSEKSPWQKTL